MSQYSLPGEATTERLAVRAVEDSQSIQTFIDGLEPFQQARFLEIAHHLVYLGFEEGVDRIDINQLRELQRTMNNLEGRGYIKGVIDTLYLVEEAQGEL